jgi:hypothetical protein
MILRIRLLSDAQILNGITPVTGTNSPAGNRGTVQNRSHLAFRNRPDSTAEQAQTNWPSA